MNNESGGVERGDLAATAIKHPDFSRIERDIPSQKLCVRVRLFFLQLGAAVCWCAACVVWSKHPEAAEYNA